MRVFMGVVCGALALLVMGWSLAGAADPVFVDDDFTAATPGWGVTHFATVQDGVDNVDVDGTVNVAAGTYVEQVEISQNLTLIGVGTGSTIVEAPVGMTTFFTTAGPNDNYPVIYVHDAATVTIEDLTVDGAGEGNSNYRFIGVGYRNAGGDINNCEILDIADTPMGGAQHGVAIYAFADDGNARVLTIDTNDISGFQKNGMALNGADLTVSVIGNTVTGAGTINFIAQNGVQIGFGATGSISGNVISGFSYDPATYASAGVLLWSAAGAVPTNLNTVGECQVGIWYIDASGTITDNTVTNTVGAMGATPYWWAIVADPGAGSGPQPSAQPFDAPSGPEPVSGAYRSAAALTTSVTGNTVDCGGNGTGIEADALGTETLTFTAEQNLVTNCAAAFSLYKDAGATLIGTVFNNSADATNTLGLENATLVLQDASGNWWGSTDPTTVAGMVDPDVDYTPWLNVGTDTNGAPGFQGDFSTLNVDDDSPQAGTLDRINEAVQLASGSTVNLLPGTYTNTAQVVIDKDLTMIGAGSGSTTINKNFATSGSGDARGWYLVDTGWDFDLSDVTLDGTGWDTYQAIRNKGEGSLTDVVFTEIKYPTYSGVACAAFGTGPVDVTGCTFTEIGRIGVLYYGTGPSGSVFKNNTYTGKGAGDWLDYAADISAGIVMTVEDNVITNNLGVASSDGSTSAGLLVTTYFGGGTTATITGNTLTGNTAGIAVGFDSSDTSDVEAHYNLIYGNTWGVTSTAGPLVNALTNWWGDATGPLHPTLNPGGLGNAVTDSVLFDPWMTSPNEVAVVPTYGITNCTTNTFFTFHINRAGPAMRGFEVTFTVNPAVVVVSNVNTDITEDNYLSDVNGTAFYPLDNGGGSYTVTNAILGGTVGATGPGDLFTVEFTPVGAGTSPITITTLKVRDLNNQPLPSAGVDGTVEVDCTVPTMDWPLDEADSLCYNTAPTFATFCFHDDVNLDLAEYQIDALGWNTIFTAIDTTDWCDPGWMLPGFGGLSEGLHTVYFRVKDDAGNWNGGGTPDTYSWQFVKDTVAPGVPTALVALPGHNKVHLTWTNPTGDVSFAGVEVRRTGWGDYPQYGTPGPPAPSYPANETEGTFIVQTSLEAYDDSVTTRDIYYYSLFAYDCAGNYSALGVTAKDRSTSYFLGDIDPALVGNGLVQILDLAKFSMTFGQLQGGPGWNMEGDFGPTDDFSRFGIPLPDDVVDFEDLMIFAMQYGNVLPSLAPEIRGVAAAEALGDVVSFKLVPISSEGGTVTLAVVVDNQAATLKGFAVTVDCGIANELLSVSPGVNVSRDTGSFFGTIEGDMGRITLCVAALGTDAPLTLSGEVARLDVRSGSDEVPHVRLQKIDLRDVDNTKEEIDVLDGPTELPYIPKTTALMQNHPNPFNPTTTIVYDVSTAGHVTIDIYDVSGRRVRTLVNGHKDAGQYTVVWDARDLNATPVHTGVYFYRMNAPGFTSPAKKMLLLK